MNEQKENNLSLKKAYAELVTLTQLYLMREHPMQEMQLVDQNIYNDFQRYVKKVSTSTPQPVHLPPPKINSTPPPSSPVKTSSEPPPSLPIVENVPKSNQILPLEPLSVSFTAPSIQDFKPLLQKHFPHYLLKEDVPSDALAKKKRESWKTTIALEPVIILTLHENEQERFFLRNFMNAIIKELVPVRMLPAIKIEEESKWERFLQSQDVRLIIVHRHILSACPQAHRHYRSDAQYHFLGQIPVLFLTDISDYLHQPALKKELWKEVCQRIRISPN